MNSETEVRLLCKVNQEFQYYRKLKDAARKLQYLSKQAALAKIPFDDVQAVDLIFQALKDRQANLAYIKRSIHHLELKFYQDLTARMS